jgi:hypothetical protein
MSLSALPDELLIQITELVEDTKILARLCRCSRRFSRVARPALYSSFRQTGPTALPFFLRTILSEENGHLALHVRKYTGSTRNSNKLDMSVLTHENRIRIEEVIKQICDIQQPDSVWVVWLYGRQNWDAVTALTLSLLPNLESIDMVAYGSENCYPFIQNVLSRASRLQHEKSRSLFSMQKLHSVCLKHHDMKSGLGMHYIMPFLDLRSVKVFKGHMISDANYQWDPTSTFDTDEVSITYSNLDAISLQRFLRHFTRLRKFEYEHAGAIVGDSDLVPMAIDRGASHLVESLEELDITNWDINWILSDDTDSFDPIHSLAEFKKLRIIEATAYVLLGKEEVPNHNEGADFGLPWYGDEAVQTFIESLPVSLEHLTIKDCSVAIFDCLAKWLEEGIPPKLNTVKVIFNPDYEMDAPKREGCLTGAELEKMALDRGVVLTRHECYQ